MSDRTDQHGHRCDTGYFDRTLCPEPCDMMHSYCTLCGKRQDRCAWDDAPAVPPSSSEQGLSRTDGLTEVSGPQNGAEDLRPRNTAPVSRGRQRKPQHGPTGSQQT